MRKIVSLLLAVFLSAGLAAGCSNSGTEDEQKTLNILTWDGYIPEDVLNAFQESSGISVNIANFNDNEEMLSKLEATNGGQYDVVIGSDYIIDIAAKRGLLSELDKSKIPNYDNLDPVYLSQYYDPNNVYTVPYGPGTPLIVYDPAKVTIDIKGYNDLWDPALANSIVMMDDARNVIGITLKSMGYSMNETDEAILEEAKEKLFQLKPNIHHLDYNNPYDSLISGEVSVAYMFTSQVNTALNERPELQVVYPEEGMGFGIDCWFIPLNAPHKDAAHEFLNYILDAETGAKISESILYMCPNQASYDYLSDDFKNNKALHIPSDILGETEFIKDVGEAATLYDSIWTEFKQQ